MTLRRVGSQGSHICIHKCRVHALVLAAVRLCWRWSLKSLAPTQNVNSAFLLAQPEPRRVTRCCSRARAPDFAHNRCCGRFGMVVCADAVVHVHPASAIVSVQLKIELVVSTREWHRTPDSGPDGFWCCTATTPGVAHAECALAKWYRPSPNQWCSPSAPARPPAVPSTSFPPGRSLAPLTAAAGVGVWGERASAGGDERDHESRTVCGHGGVPGGRGGPVLGDGAPRPRSSSNHGRTDISIHR